jgi:hypothetical protein
MLRNDSSCPLADKVPTLGQAHGQQDALQQHALHLLVSSVKPQPKRQTTMPEGGDNADSLYLSYTNVSSA